jgi:hypothetical protein
MAKILDGVRRGGYVESDQLSPATISECASRFDNRRVNQRSRAYDNRNYVSGACDVTWFFKWRAKCLTRT